jgi:ABC-type transporter Mla MlaB component
MPSWLLARWCRPDLALVDQLARLQLHARRLGCSIRLRGADAELVELLALVGLTQRSRAPPA